MKKIIISTDLETFKAMQDQGADLLFINGTYHLEKKKITALETIRLRWTASCALIQSLVAYITFHLNNLSQVPLSGVTSIGSNVIISGILGAFAIFTIAYFVGKVKNLGYARGIPYRNYPALAVAISIVVAVALLFSFYLLNRLFNGLALDRYVTTLLLFFIFNVVDYLVLAVTFSINPSVLTRLLIYVMIGGVGIAMITNSDKFWWHNNLSFLGTLEASNAWQFNITMILSALLMVSVVDYLFIALKKRYPKHLGLALTRILLTVTAISLGLVGYWRADGPGLERHLHVYAAGTLVLIAVILMTGMPWLLPKRNKNFIKMTYVIEAALVVFTLLFMYGYYLSLTAYELISFFICFVWMVSLFNHLNTLYIPQVPLIESNFRITSEK